MEERRARASSLPRLNLPLKKKDLPSVLLRERIWCLIASPLMNDIMET